MLLRILLMIWLTFNSYGADIKILVGDIPPYSKKNPGGSGSGVVYDIVQELSKRMGQQQKLEFVPWVRAQVEVEKNQNMGIAPLARIKSRENKYRWLIHILDDPYVLFVLKDSKIDISSIEKANQLSIGILRGSVGEYELEELGFKNIQRINDESQNIKMLKHGRIDAWAAPLSYMIRFNEEDDLPKKEIKVGMTLMILHEYLVFSKDIDDKTAIQWQKAFDSMRNDGSYASIMRKYNFDPLK